MPPRDKYVRRLPEQARAAATVDCIVIAAERVICSVGWERFSTNRVAKIAGVSIGTVYRYFPHRDAVARALVERVWAREWALFERVLDEGGSFVELGRAYVAYVAANIPLYREWYTHLVPIVATEAPAWDARVVDRLAAAFTNAEDGIEPREACEALYVSGLHMVRRAASVRPESFQDGTLDRALLTLMRGFDTLPRRVAG